jgi:hypothetical protein
MLSSFAASTCRTILAPFRYFISDSSALRATRRIEYSKIVGAVGFEPTKPLACKASALPLSYAPLVPGGRAMHLDRSQRTGPGGVAAPGGPHEARAGATVVPAGS